MLRKQPYWNYEEHFVWFIEIMEKCEVDSFLSETRVTTYGRLKMSSKLD